MRFEGFETFFSPSFEPFADRSLTDSQRNSNILLLPALFFQLLGSFPSFFSPIGFLWCSHASYLSTLYLSLPRSVVARDAFPLHSPLFHHHLVLDSSIIYIQKNLEQFSFLFRACSGYTLHTAPGSFRTSSSTRENGR
jgi:hypothetical protein